MEHKSRFIDGVVVGAMLMLVFELLMLRCENKMGLDSSERATETVTITKD